MGIANTTNFLPGHKAESVTASIEKRAEPEQSGSASDTAMEDIPPIPERKDFSPEEVPDSCPASDVEAPVGPKIPGIAEESEVASLDEHDENANSLREALGEVLIPLSKAIKAVNDNQNKIRNGRGKLECESSLLFICI